MKEEEDITFMTGGELLVIVLGIGVHVLYYEEGLSKG
jgi:hypothetical protein